MASCGKKKSADILGMETAVYRHFDKFSNLLYVGVSLSPASRTSSHYRDSDWFKDVARIDVEWHESRIEALNQECLAIFLESPKYNQNENSDRLRTVFCPLYGERPKNVKKITRANDGRMKNKLINIRVSQADYDRWKSALEHDGRTLSEVCRAALDRVASRAERKLEAQE